MRQVGVEVGEGVVLVAVAVAEAVAWAVAALQGVVRERKSVVVEEEEVARLLAVLWEVVVVVGLWWGGSGRCMMCVLEAMYGGVAVEDGSGGGIEVSNMRTACPRDSSEV